MSVSKVRLFAFGLAAAGIVAAGLLVADPSGTSESGSGAPVRVADQPEPPKQAGKQADDGVRVEAPGTVVDVDKERGKVSVTAPYTDVRVDPDKGRVQVRVPYVNLDIRW
jgi:hypothetical protein